MSDQRFIDVAPAAYAALGPVLASLGGETARVLDAQARRALVIRDVPGRMIDLEVPVGSQPCDCSDGPLPVRAAVVRQGGQLVGELLVWVRDGWLVGLEQAWFTDEPPERWPLGEELVFQ
ncbi:hypothetical protein [Cellulomonas gelida]|uniref:Uncharacterized protein n=1 Tax=Cellulomonas gelida TaxID=1712 RepID=A0A4Y3KS14_9CELL|nr:hypothetical protein [Cellulomonas gelida]GEA85975.1 hypothetical protein CGE01nite_32260 [Cellulomonas gelida]GGL19154.1 hypothetical protein GCM10009774_06850 [Cellulomonas gelida]